MKTILVVEDEENLLQLYRDELAECGYRVIAARSAREALECMRSERPDLVTLDIKLRNGPDGIEVLRSIKEIDSSVPVLINTAYGEYKQNFGVWASEGYIVKSGDLEELKSRIAELLAR